MNRLIDLQSTPKFFGFFFLVQVSQFTTEQIFNYFFLLWLHSFARRAQPLERSDFNSEISLIHLATLQQTFSIRLQVSAASNAGKRLPGLNSGIQEVNSVLANG